MVSPNSLQTRLKAFVDDLVAQGIPLDQARREFERQFIIACISANEGNLSRSAKGLGIHRNTLRNKIEALSINTENARTTRRPAKKAEPKSEEASSSRHIASSSAS